MAKRKIDEQISYNWLFFLLAGAFAAVTVWAVYDEVVTRREYKKYQEAFFQVDKDLNKQRLDAEKKKLAGNARYKELEKRKADIDAELRGPKKGDIEKQQAELQDKTFAAFDHTQAYTFAKSEMDQAYYFFTVAKHEHLEQPSDAQRTKEYDEKKEAYEKLQKRTEDAQKEMDKFEGAKKDAQAKLDEITHAKEVLEIKKEMEFIARPADEAQRAYDLSASKLAGALGPATEIIQQNLPEISKVDRCESCHLGANRSGFETVAQKEFRSHPLRRTLLTMHPPEKFGCTTCHDGQGRATDKFYAHAPGKDEDSHAFETHFWEYPVLKGPPKGDPTRYSKNRYAAYTGHEYMESKCRGCHKNEWDLRGTVPCEIDAECPNAEDGRAMICAVPAPTTTVGAPHATVEQAEAAIAAEQAKKDAIAKGQPLPPDADPVKYCVERHDAAEKKLSADDEKQRAKIVEKSTVATMDLAPHLSRGLKIIEEAGCFGCHPIEGYQDKPKPAPDLTHVAAKANPAWMVEWIKNPKNFRPNTRMPRFWPEITAPNEYPYAIDVEGLKKTQNEEATAMAAFLLHTSKESKKYEYKLEPIPVAGDAKHGAELVGSLGCPACHNVPVADAQVEHKNRASHFDHGPDLTNVGAKTSKEWIYNWVMDPKRYAPGTRMPNLRLTPQEGADIAEYLSTQTGGKTFTGAGPNLDDPALIAKGQERVKYYGCFGCHKIEGYEETPGIGAELTEFGVKTVDRLDFGDYIPDHDQQTWDAWTFNKLRHPRVFAYDTRAVLRMPQFDLADDEVRAVMVVLKGMRGEDAIESQVLAKKLTPDEIAREQGKSLVRWYNCFGCHTVDGRDGDIRQLAKYKGENTKFAPPLLGGEGEKTQPDWLFGFLKRPFKMRPLPTVRMPTFGFSNEDATTLVWMFSSFDKAAYPFSFYTEVAPPSAQDEQVGKALFVSSQCTKCHLVSETGGAIPESVVAPNLVLAKKRLRAEWVTHWLADPNSLQKDTAMPAFWLGEKNPLELPDAKALLGGLSDTFLEPFLKSKERQIAAVRDFLFVLTPEKLGGGATTAAAEPAKAGGDTAKPGKTDKTDKGAKKGKGTQ